ncbi:MAG: prepilin-type N-terminal cleavage/methylation domain-containing protein [Candidatus Hydrogenedentes bacterium]|nr:prepilin-type N-terminal cleavage/methylation domain-containing protein [Candidatus Hydrogenedentota bacterium]
MNHVSHHIPGGRSAFTLLELLVVVVIIGAISMTIVPVYVGSMNGIEMRNARNDLLSAIIYAQEMAVRESREYRVVVNMKENLYYLEYLAGLEKEEKVFERATPPLNEKRHLPQFLTISKVKGRQNKGTREHYIRCLPNGASDQASIELTDERSRNSHYVVEVSGPLGQVSLKEKR